MMFTCIFYYIFCARVYDPLCAEFAIVFFATFLAAIVEGWTTQFDNLVCPLVYFILMHQIYDYFMSFNAAFNPHNN